MKVATTAVEAQRVVRVFTLAAAVPQVVSADLKTMPDIR